MNAVLLVEDQRHGRAPTHCVISGKKTDGAVKVWAIAAKHLDWIIGPLGVLGVGLARLAGRETLQITLPVDQLLWKHWQRRATMSFLVAWIGAGALAVGTIRADTQLTVFGLISIVLAMGLRGWFFRRFWVSTQLRPSTRDILIRRAHPDFGQDAKELYIAALRRR